MRKKDLQMYGIWAAYDFVALGVVAGFIFRFRFPKALLYIRKAWKESKASYFSHMSDSSMTHDEFEDGSDDEPPR